MNSTVDDDRTACVLDFYESFDVHLTGVIDAR